MKTSDYKSFNYLENGDIFFSQYSTVNTTEKLIPGSYSIDFIEHPEYKVKLKLNKDYETVKTHEFPDKEKLDTLFASFLNKKYKQKIEELGFCHKVGVLFYGVEGTGKSTIMKYYYDYLIKKHDAIVFNMLYKGYRFADCWEFVEKIRMIQNNLIVIVFDEFDEQMKENESLLKKIIDGNMSINDCVFLAATNHFDNLPKAMTSRPSRFKYCLNIEGVQCEDDIVNIINPFLKDILTNEEITLAVKSLKGKTLDYIKQFCFDKIMQIEHSDNVEKKVGF